MKQNLRICRLIGCCALLLSAGITTSWAQKWKYLPKRLVKPTKTPAVMNPSLSPGVQKRLVKLDLEFEINLERAKAKWNGYPHALYIPSASYTCPPQFKNFITWLDQLQSKRQIANRTTLEALQQVRRAIFAYSALNSSEQAQVNLLVIALNKFREAKLGKSNNGNFYKIVYHPTSDKEALPQAQAFHLLLERRGILKNHFRTQHILNQPIASFTFAEDYEDTNKIIGLTFLQGFQPDKTRQELEYVLDYLTPPGYTVRISTHEIGLSNNRQKFRQGFLHVHFEQINSRPGVVTLDSSIELWLGVTPYVGVINPKTRKIIVPFSDKKIAQNYLILFNKYLTPHTRYALERISE